MMIYSEEKKVLMVPTVRYDDDDVYMGSEGGKVW